MFNDLLVHPRTLLQLEQFLKNPTHGLMLVGPQGAGKRTLAQVVAAAVLDITVPDKLFAYPYYSLVDPVEPTITIDEIRALEQLLKLKTPAQGGQEIRRIIAIIDAGRMRFEAQNAFLKNLEEPPADTCIIMTAEANGDLLPTIYSRMVTIEVLPVSVNQAAEFYARKGIPSAAVSRNYALSQGQVGLLDALLQDVKHPLKDAVELAKKLLSMPAGERLFHTDELSKDKIATNLLLNALGRITHAALVNAGKTGNTAAVERWRASLAAVQASIKSTSSNANTKLLLDHLLLNL